jgi:hypothetical protein
MELDETKLAELDAAKSMGPELKLHGTETKIIDLVCLIMRSFTVPGTPSRHVGVPSKSGRPFDRVV